MGISPTTGSGAPIVVVASLRFAGFFSLTAIDLSVPVFLNLSPERHG
jgi:hypothetical protein